MKTNQRFSHEWSPQQDFLLNNSHAQLNYFQYPSHQQFPMSPNISKPANSKAHPELQNGIESNFSSRHQSPVDRSPNRKGTISWGISPNENVFQTSYQTTYTTNDRLSPIPRRRDAFSPSQCLSDSLIPFDFVQTRRVKKDGAYNTNFHRRSYTEEDNFFDKIGERVQSPSKRGLLRIEEPRTKDRGLSNENRFYRPIEANYGATLSNVSPSRLAKTILDYCPPQCMTEGAGIATKNNETLTYEKDISFGYNEVVAKLGLRYSNVVKKVEGSQYQGQKLPAKNRQENKIKSIDPNNKNSQAKLTLRSETDSFYKGKITSKRENKFSKPKTVEKSNSLIQSNSERLLKEIKEQEKKLFIQNYKMSKNNNVQRSPWGYNPVNGGNFDLNKQKIQKRRQIRSTSSKGDFELDKKMIKNLGGNDWVNKLFAKIRSNSVQSIESTIENKSRKSSHESIRNLKKESSKERQSFIVVAHEKKKPISAGIYKTPQLKKNYVQKFLDLPNRRSTISSIPTLKNWK